MVTLVSIRVYFYRSICHINLQIGPWENPRNVFSYSALISCLKAAKKWQHALVTFQTMPMTEVTRAAAIDALESWGVLKSWGFLQPMGFSTHIGWFGWFGGTSIVGNFQMIAKMTGNPFHPLRKSFSLSHTRNLGVYPIVTHSEKVWRKLWPTRLVWEWVW